MNSSLKPLTKSTGKPRKPVKRAKTDKNSGLNTNPGQSHPTTSSESGLMFHRKEFEVFFFYFLPFLSLFFFRLTIITSQNTTLLQFNEIQQVEFDNEAELALADMIWDPEDDQYWQEKERKQKEREKEKEKEKKKDGDKKEDKKEDAKKRGEDKKDEDKKEVETKQGAGDKKENLAAMKMQLLMIYNQRLAERMLRADVFFFFSFLFSLRIFSSFFLCSWLLIMDLTI